MEYLYFLLEDGDELAPGPEYPKVFAEALGIDLTAFPILADPAKGIAAATGLNPKAVPGKCVLAPEMRIVGCYGGADDTPGFEMIVADAQQ